MSDMRKSVAAELVIGLGVTRESGQGGPLLGGDSGV
jgi:hypothetical protein